MAWTTPMTAVANEIFTAAQYNTYVRDNLLETAPAKATVSSQYFLRRNNALITNVSGSTVEEASETTASTTYTNLTTVGPSMSRTINFGFIAFLGCRRISSSSTEGAFMSMDIIRESDMVTVFSADDAVSVGHFGSGAVRSAGSPEIITGLTPGDYTFTAKYRSTNAASTATFASRWLHVIPF